MKKKNNNFTNLCLTNKSKKSNIKLTLSQMPIFIECDQLQHRVQMQKKKSNKKSNIFPRNKLKRPIFIYMPIFMKGAQLQQQGAEEEEQ